MICFITHCSELNPKKFSASERWSMPLENKWHDVSNYITQLSFDIQDKYK